MTRLQKPAHLPTRNGVSPSCVALPAGHWPTVLDFLCERLPAVSREQWHSRMAQAQVLNTLGEPIAAAQSYTPNTRVFYYRDVGLEPVLPARATVLFQDDHLVVADKPHFMPVTPSGRYVQQSLLVQLKRDLQLEMLSPIHRIDRETAGLVLFSVRAQDRGAYQALFRERAVRKVYEAVAPRLENVRWPITRRSRIEASADFFRSQETAGEPNSETHVSLLHAANDVALYRLEPVTGKRHQLRIHLTALGAPIEGDQFYPQIKRRADEPEDFSQPLQLLARSLAFTDPITGQARFFESRLQLRLRCPG